MLTNVENTRSDATRVVDLLAVLARTIWGLQRTRGSEAPWLIDAATEIDALADQAEMIRDGLVSCLLATCTAASDPALADLAAAFLQATRDWAQLLERAMVAGTDVYRCALTRLADIAAVREEQHLRPPDADERDVPATVLAGNARTIRRIQHQVRSGSG